MSLKILQVVKTVNGAQWALEQVKVLCSLGHDVHVALNSNEGTFIDQWRSSGATLHYLDLDFPTRVPWRFAQRVKNARSLIQMIKPDIIHSHFFGTTIVLRSALKSLSIPLVFQVPGPLHLENIIFRTWELLTSSSNDYWIASSRYIRSLYLKSGIEEKKVYLSYYGSDYQSFSAKRNNKFRTKYGISQNDIAVGNVSYIYAPKYHLFQFSGLKNHEVIIDSLNFLGKENSQIKGLLVGGQWGSSDSYEKKLRSIANKNNQKTVTLTGKVDPWMAHEAWNNLDIAIHLPLSENCGGVLEPLLCELPTICSKTGGLPEVIIDGVTGFHVKDTTSKEINEKITYVCSNLNESKEIAKRGKELVTHMFDVKRTAKEVELVYLHILKKSQERPKEFDAYEYLGVEKK